MSDTKEAKPSGDVDARDAFAIQTVGGKAGTYCPVSEYEKAARYLATRLTECKAQLAALQAERDALWEKLGKLQRWDIGCHECGCEDMPHPDGQAVLWSDIDALVRSVIGG